MKLMPQCVPCFFKQASIVANMVNVDDSTRIKLFKGVAKVLSEVIDENASPAKIATPIHNFIRQFLGVTDPFADVKRLSNDKMLSLYDSFKGIIAKSKEPLKMAAIFAIIGNLIDYSLFEDINLETIEEKVKSFKPAIFDFEEFSEYVSKSERVLYITDNAGEIVFDKLLIEELFRLKKKVIIVAKEKPILNDATVEDANYVSLSKLGKVFGTGNSDVGTIYPSQNDLLNKAFRTANMIISKGQANFETLIDTKGPLFFLFVVKCKAVADYLKVEEGAPLLLKRR
ncbi:MAG: ARMT1-like domain-containing protein [bacterium]